jgi:tetratricopeptide (TPR) repeat protein
VNPPAQARLTSRRLFEIRPRSGIHPARQQLTINLKSTLTTWTSLCCQHSIRPTRGPKPECLIGLGLRVRRRSRSVMVVLRVYLSCGARVSPLCRSNWSRPMRTMLALCLGLLYGVPSLASAHPVQIPECPSISYFHGADKPNRVGPKHDSTTWLTWPNNTLAVSKHRYNLKQLEKRFELDPSELRTQVCGDSGTACASGLVSVANDGFADTYILVIPVTTRSGAMARFFLHEAVCVDWEKERSATSCGGGDVSGNLVSVVYSAAGGEGESDSLMWQQIFDRKTGALLLTTESTDRMSETLPIRIKKDGTVVVDGCGRWAADDLRQGKPPVVTGGAVHSGKVKALISVGRKATEKGKYAAAINAFSDAIKLQPDAVKAWSGRGFAHLKAGRPKPALSDFRHVLKTYRATMDKKTITMVEHNIKQAKKAIDSD